MDAERQRSAYRELLTALDEAIFWLARVPAAGPHDSGAERQGTFRLGEAGGIAFSAHFPGMDSEALFDDISDAVETDDLDAVRRVRSLVESRLRSEDDGTGDDETAGGGGDSGGPAPPPEGAFDWDAGYLQILGVLNETRCARDAGDAHRYWIMAGFMAGLLHWDERPGEHEPESSTTPWFPPPATAGGRTCGLSGRRSGTSGWPATRRRCRRIRSFSLAGWASASPPPTW